MFVLNYLFFVSKNYFGLKKYCSNIHIYTHNLEANVQRKLLWRIKTPILSKLLAQKLKETRSRREETANIWQFKIWKIFLIKTIYSKCSYIINSYIHLGIWYSRLDFWKKTFLTHQIFWRTTITCMTRLMFIMSFINISNFWQFALEHFFLQPFMLRKNSRKLQNYSIQLVTFRQFFL